MDKNLHKDILKQAPFGYAYHKLILNEEGKAVDYEFLDVNPAFEDLTGLKAKEILNKKVTETIPGIAEKGDFDWIGYYGNLAIKGGKAEFEQYSEPLKKWYKVNAYSNEKYYFTTIFTDITQEKFISNTSKYFLEKDDEEPDYQKICDDLLAITNAKYIALNIIDDNGKDFITVAISGIGKHIKKASEIFGFELTGKKWKYDPVRSKKIQDKQITKFKKISDLTGEAFPKKTIALIESFFKAGEIAVIKIMKEERVLGDFTVIMHEGETLKNESLWEIFAQQIGLFLQKLGAEKYFKKESLFRKHLLDDIPGYLALVLKKDTREIVASNKAATRAGAVPGKTCFGTSAMRNAPCPFCKADEMWKTGETQNIEVEYRGKWYEGHWAPLSDDLYMHYIRDITEDKNAENSLRQSEEKYSELIENIDSIFWKFDIINNQWTFVSPQTKKMLGYEPQEWTDYDFWLNRLHEDDREWASNYCRECTEEGISHEFEYRFKRKDGSYIWLYDEVKVVMEDDKPVGMWGILRDITKRKQAEQALLESEESFRGLYENATVGIYRTTPDGKILLANPALLKMMGYKSFEEVAGRNLEKEGYDNIYSRTEFKEEIEKAGKIICRESSWKTKTGETIYITESAHVVYDDNGNISFYEGFVEDITDRKLNEMLLKARFKLMEGAESLSTEELLKQTLKEAELLTKSKVGFYHFYNEEKGEITISQWSERTEKEFCFVEKEYDKHYPLVKAGVWTDCIKKRKAIIHNDYESLPHKKGLPQGHVKISRYLAVPVIRNKRIHAIIGVGNKDVDYKKTDVRLVAQLADMMCDVAERKKHEEILKNYERIFINTNDMLCIIGYDGLIKDVNPTWYKNTGWKKEELLSKQCVEFLNKEDVEKTNNALDNAYSGEKILHFENRFICKDDTEKWFLWDFIPYKDENIVIGVARDNTKSVVLEKEKERFNKLLIERVKELTFINNFSKMVYRSKAGVPDFFDQVVKFLPHAFQNPDKTYIKISSDYLNKKSTKFKNTKHKILESFYTKSLGKTTITVCTIPEKGNENNPFFNEEVNLLRTVKEILASYIQKLEAQEKEKLSEKKFMEIFNNVKDIVFIADNSGNIINVNTEFTEQLGYNIMPGTNYTEIIKKDCVKRVKETLTNNFKSKKKQVSINVDIVNSKAETKTFETRIKVKYKNNKAYEIFGVARDITDLLKHQNLLMKTIIDTEEKEKKHFSEELHDGIGPLLSGINMYLERIRSRKNIPEEDEKLLVYCNELVTDAINQIRIISNNLMPQLLNKYGLSRALNSFIDKLNLLKQFSINITGSSIKVGDIPTDTGIILYRSITELINNTLKHANAQNIDIVITKRHNSIYVTYKDDGKGFSIVNYLSSSKKAGLGLKNILSRIKSINGSVNFPASKDKGFIIKIEVPVKPIN